MNLRSVLFGMVAVFSAGACSGSSDSSFGGAAEGTERGACRANHSCDPGLVCLSDLCVSQGSSGGNAGSGGSSDAAAGSGGSNAGSGGSSAGAAGSGGSSAGAAGVGGSSGGAAGASGSGGTAGASGSAGAGASCQGSHPNIEQQRRFCDVGSCYCTDPFDTCFSSSSADRCCQDTPICGDNTTGGGVNCAGMHPIIGPPRTCQSGYCFCSNGSTVDVCHPKDVSAACCPPSITPVCVP